MLCRSDERKRPIKKSRRMLEAEEAQVRRIPQATLSTISSTRIVPIRDLLRQNSGKMIIAVCHLLLMCGMQKGLGMQSSCGGPAQVLAVSEAEEEALKQGAAAGHEPAGGAAPDLAAEPAQRECLDTEARPADHDPKTPHTPTRGTSALVRA